MKRLINYPVGVISSWADGAFNWLLLEKRGLWGLSAARILVGITVLGLLVSNFSVRHVLWGPGSGWAEASRGLSEFGALLELFGTGSTSWFTFQYLTLIGVALAVTLGWHTRIMTVVLAFGLSSLVSRAENLGDQGDNIARIGLVLMIFMSTAEHWSLDAHRKKLRADSKHDSQKLPVLALTLRLHKIPQWCRNLLHNAAFVALALQIFILYTASAMYKTQGDQWQDGTAIFYPLQLPEYAIFPELNPLLVEVPVLLNLATYVAVFAQLFIVVALLHPLSRRLVLVAVIGMHIGIALFMGLPWFSLAMVAFDAIFISQRTYQAVENTVRSVTKPLRERFKKPARPLDTASDEVRQPTTVG